MLSLSCLYLSALTIVLPPYLGFGTQAILGKTPVRLESNSMSAGEPCKVYFSFHLPQQERYFFQKVKFMVSSTSVKKKKEDNFHAGTGRTNIGKKFEIPLRRAYMRYPTALNKSRFLIPILKGSETNS